MNIADSAAATGVGATILFLVIGLVAFAAYLAPGIVASYRHVPNQGSVWALNILLGWTLVFWAIAMAMACRSRYQAVMAPYQPGQIPPPPPPAGFQPPAPQPYGYGPSYDQPAAREYDAGEWH